jgi:hypothetical protein
MAVTRARARREVVEEEPARQEAAQVPSPVRDDSRDTGLAAAQDGDPTVRALRLIVSGRPEQLAQMSSGEAVQAAQSLARRHRFVLDGDGVLVRVDGSPQTVVPEGQLREQVCWLAHGLGHRGFKKTLDVVSGRCWWPTMKRDVKEFNRTCKICQLQQGRPVHAGEMRHLPAFTTAFACVAVDFVGPLPETSSGYKHIAVFVDLASRWVEAYPCSNATAEAFSWSLNQWISCFGVPARVHTDRAQAFLEQGVELAFARLQVHHSCTTPYRPQGDPAECAVKSVVKVLRALLLDGAQDTAVEKRQWDQLLPSVLLALHGTVSDATGITPFRYLFGMEMRLPLDVLLHRGPPQETWTHLQKLPERLEQLRLQAAAHNEQRRVRSKELYDETHYSAHQFNAGEEVLVYNQPSVTKLEPRWAGPFRVLKIYENG